MRIQKVGKARPILCKGQLSVPTSVISRLAIAKNHLELAQIAHFNGKINQYYMTIDNLLAAVIAAKEGCLTTTSHPKKIEKFFIHLGRRARLRKIDKDDFDEFYELWADSRYKVYFPKSEVVEKIRLFTNHLFNFVLTEIARFYKSDETILAEKVNDQLKVYNSQSIEKEAAAFMEACKEAKPDVLIIEGTRVNSDSSKKEAEVEDEICDISSKAKGLSVCNLVSKRHR